jgi:hypothetical protein
MDRNQLNEFWNEMSGSDHFVQIYDADEAFMDTLVSFVSDGLKAGQAAVVIATPRHRDELDRRLSAMGIDVDGAKLMDRFQSLDAERTLEKFMVDGWPDETLFNGLVSGLLKRAAHNGRKVRAFGEMVVLLWAQGQTAATMQLEHLWTELCSQHSFALFCAYPKIGFTGVSESIAHVCAAHSRVLDA